MLRINLLRAPLLAALAFLSIAPIHAQVLSGSIVGQVLDSTSAGVPGASVRITHRQTNQSRSTATNTSGEYSFQSLPGGDYDVSVGKQGFQSYNAQSVPL